MITVEEVEEVEEVSEARFDDETIHVACCCTPNKSICGVADDLSDEWEPSIPRAEDCVVCTHMEWGPCPYCGRRAGQVCVHGNILGECHGEADASA